jgi:hypothetical protein
MEPTTIVDTVAMKDAAAAALSVQLQAMTEAEQLAFWAQQTAILHQQQAQERAQQPAVHDVAH